MRMERPIYLQKLIDRKHNGMVKIITEMRRCGKSYLLFNLFADHLKSEGADEQHIIAADGSIGEDRGEDIRIHLFALAEQSIPLAHAPRYFRFALKDVCHRGHDYAIIICLPASKPSSCSSLAT